MTIISGIFKTYAVDATKPPSAKLPVSPINTRAGYTLNTKNPSRLPTVAHVIGATPEPKAIATIEKNVAINTVTEDASPSRPSVKLEPFVVPSITKNIKFHY